MCFLLLFALYPGCQPTQRPWNAIRSSPGDLSLVSLLVDSGDNISLSACTVCVPKGIQMNNENRCCPVNSGLSR